VPPVAEKVKLIVPPTGSEGRWIGVRMVRLVAGATLVRSVAESLAGFESDGAPVTSADAETVPANSGTTVTWNAATPLTASVPAEHTTGPVPVQAPAGLEETKVAEAGKDTVTVTPLAAAVPLLLTFTW
jgi:hypothetical protein